MSDEKKQGKQEKQEIKATVSDKDIASVLSDLNEISTGSAGSKIQEKHKLLLIAVIQRKGSVPLMDLGKLLFKLDKGRLPSTKNDEDRKVYQVWSRRFKKLVESEEHLELSTDTPYTVFYVK